MTKADSINLKVKDLKAKRKALQEQINKIKFEIDHIDYILKNHTANPHPEPKKLSQLSVKDAIIVILERIKYVELSKYELFEKVKELKEKVNVNTFETVLSKLSNDDESNIHRTHIGTYVYR